MQYSVFRVHSCPRSAGTLFLSEETSFYFGRVLSSQKYKVRAEMAESVMHKELSSIPRTHVRMGHGSWKSALGIPGLGR